MIQCLKAGCSNDFTITTIGEYIGGDVLYECEERLGCALRWALCIAGVGFEGLKGGVHAFHRC